MLNGWHVWWVCWPCKNWDVFSFQELCTDPFNMGPCIIMLQHEVMVVDEWHNNGPQDLVTVSLWIQNAMNKMYLCSLSITYVCPYHNPTATMGHSIHNVDISKPLPYTTPYALSAICPVQWKSGLIHEENTSPKCQTPSTVSIFPETVSDSLCRNSLVMQTDCCSSCPGGWSQMILEVNMLDVEVLGWCGYTWSAVVRPNSLKRLWRRLMVEKWTSNSWATALVDIAAVRMPIARSFKTCNICGIVLCDKTAHFRVAFYCGQPIRHTCATIMLSNQHLDMPHLWGGWIISTKEKCSLTLTDLDRFVNNIWEK